MFWEIKGEFNTEKKKKDQNISELIDKLKKISISDKILLSSEEQQQHHQAKTQQNQASPSKRMIHAETLFPDTSLDDEEDLFSESPPPFFQDDLYSSLEQEATTGNDPIIESQSKNLSERTPLRVNRSSRSYIPKRASPRELRTSTIKFGEESRKRQKKKTSKSSFNKKIDYMNAGSSRANQKGTGFTEKKWLQMSFL